MKKLFLLAIVVLGFTAVSFAQGPYESNAATATAKIVVPLSISKTTDMNFGIISNIDAGTIVLGTASGTTGSTAIHLGGTTTAAAFTVVAAAGTTFSISIPATTILLKDPVSLLTIPLTALVSDPSLTGSVLTGETNRVIHVGGTVTIVAGQTAGTYANATDLKVTVDYN